MLEICTSILASNISYVLCTKFFFKINMLLAMCLSAHMFINDSFGEI